MWNEDWYSQAFSGWEEEEGGGNTAVEQRELNHFSTCGLCILWQKLMFFWLVLPPAWSDAGSRCSMEQRNNFAPWLSVQLRFCAWKSENRGVELAEQLFPFRLLFSWLCERWCLFLLACPRRRWATDFTHFYWLIWLCSCQQLRVSQESEILRDSATATATVAALLWLRGAWRDQRRGGRLSPVS